MNNLEKENFIILGAGNMGICFVKALIQNRIKVNRIKIIEKNPSRELMALKRKKKIEVFKDAKKISTNINPSIVLLAVKPNQLSQALSNEFLKITKNSLIISIIAGKSLKELKRVTKIGLTKNVLSC